MKRNSLYTTGRFALTGAALAACLMASNAWALGLGRLQVQSSLGEILRAEIDVTSITPEEASNLNIRIAPPESYRAAGVDYNSVLPGTQVLLQRRADGRSFLSVTSDRAVQEPFIDVILEITWSTGRLVREYTLLLDPPVTRTAASPVPAAPAATTSPLISPAPTEPVAVAPRAAERKPVTPKASATTDGAPVEPRKPSVKAPASSPAEPIGDEYTVRPGDSLSRIAGRSQRQGVSLDQMLASLYQANPEAFVNSNINRLKSGVVLAVPSAETAKAVTPAEARQLIQAQSADFGTYRQRLAAAVPAAKTDGTARQAGGKVQSSVDDRKATAAPAPDKLTLSKGSTAKASAPEDRLSKEREKKDATARVAELSKNVDELKKLSGASGTASGKGTAPATAAPVAPPVVVPPVVAPKPPVVAAAPAPAPVVPPAPAPAPAPAPVVVVPPAPAPASAPAVVAAASAPAVMAAASAAASAVMEPASAPVVAVAPSRPMAASAPAATPVVEPPGPFASLLEDNPLVLAAGAALIALLAGFGIYRFTKRAKKDSGETSFLESRLQPDSFFGASGGQRIDTRDAGGASSSMSYSLSQLDAIGDVDPVAEADVYLAYGRDLQAEEILKEAMRASPERLAIRTKLLEVYAKRRDTKGFELLATQLFGLTGGQGEDWAKAQEIGVQIDPDNQLYQPGGKPAGAEGDGRPAAELLGASTMPQSVLPSPSEFGSSGSSGSGFDTTSGDSIDLDLDLALPDSTPPAPSRAAERTQPMAAAPAPAPSFDSMSFNLPPSPPPAPAAPATGPMDFDLGSISLDLGGDTTVAQPKVTPGVPVSSDFGAIDLGDVSDDGSDPIARKLELAEEFRQIGDTEGARDLLQEVVAKSSGAVKTRAQSMLNDLG